MANTTSLVHSMTARKHLIALLVSLLLYTFLSFTSHSSHVTRYFVSRILTHLLLRANSLWRSSIAREIEVGIFLGELRLLMFDKPYENRYLVL